METVLLLDTSVGSDNKGDDIIMECVRKELEFVLRNNFEYTLPTHVSPFHWYQVWRNSLAVRSFSDCRLKFIGGSNILVKNLLTHYPQWNINWFNCKPLAGAIGVGVGAGAGERSNSYTRQVYRNVLNHDYYHSARDERAKQYIESLGLKALNTGCVTMWMMTPEFCRSIPTSKSDTVVFTLTKHSSKDERDQILIDTLCANYREIYFWPQGINDWTYLHQFAGIDRIHILQATREAYDRFLTDTPCDYVGTRLHGGIYAMRHGRRSIIIAIDERAREINKSNHLNCIDINDIDQLGQFVTADLATEVKMDFDNINRWKAQFLSE